MLPDEFKYVKNIRIVRVAARGSGTQRASGRCPNWWGHCSCISKTYCRDRPRRCAAGRELQPSNRWRSTTQHTAVLRADCPISYRHGGDPPADRFPFSSLTAVTEPRLQILRLPMSHVGHLPNQALNALFESSDATVVVARCGAFHSHRHVPRELCLPFHKLTDTTQEPITQPIVASRIAVGRLCYDFMQERTASVNISNPC